MLSVIHHSSQQYWIFDASMQLSEQWRRFGARLGCYTLAGVFITHAHVGHYLGLLYLGKECSHSRQLPLHASEDMHTFLQTNQPFAALYEGQNVSPRALQAEQPVSLAPGLTVTPHLVQHRADFTDTLAFTIAGPSHRLYFCPDIDSWEGLAPLYSLESLLTSRDVLLLDATFFDDDELPAGRDMATIPHPRAAHTARLVGEIRERAPGRGGEVVLIHLNHSNRLWLRDGKHAEEHRRLQSAGVEVGRTGQTWTL